MRTFSARLESFWSNIIFYLFSTCSTIRISPYRTIAVILIQSSRTFACESHQILLFISNFRQRKLVQCGKWFINLIAMLNSFCSWLLHEIQIHGRQCPYNQILVVREILLISSSIIMLLCIIKRSSIQLPHKLWA